jgi:hypothetical protein
MFSGIHNFINKTGYRKIMKHTLSITLMLVGIFFVAQVVGLLVTNQYIDHQATKVTGNVTFTNLPYDIERPPVQQSSSFVYIITAVIVATILIFQETNTVESLVLLSGCPVPDHNARSIHQQIRCSRVKRFAGILQDIEAKHIHTQSDRNNDLWRAGSNICSSDERFRRIHAFVVDINL